MRWPHTSCTCSYKLGIIPNPPAAPHGPRMCLAHRAQTLIELKRKKAKNDRWLRSIDRGKTGPVYAKRSKKRARCLDMTWRACRCGRHCTPPTDDGEGEWDGWTEVWLCMCCEGWSSGANPTLRGFSRFDPGGPAVPWLPVKRLRREAQMKLSREVAS